MPPVRPVRLADAAAIAAIYNHYVRDTVITFEEVPVEVADMAARIGDVTQRHPWLVLELNGSLAGYAYASAWKARSAYRHSVESTIYLASEAAGQGLGTQLYGALIDTLRREKIHTAVGGIALPNAASIALHEKLGFRRLGQFNEIGRKFGNWVDVGYWQLLL